MRRRAASTAVLLVLAVAGPAAAQTATTRSAVGDLPFTVPALRIDAPVAGLEGVAAGADHRCVATETLLWPLAPGDPRRDGIVETTLDRLRDRDRADPAVDGCRRRAAPRPVRPRPAGPGAGRGRLTVPAAPALRG